MNKLAGIISSMDYKELKAIQRDLAEGNMGRLIKLRIEQIEKTQVHEEKMCPTCGNQVDETMSPFTLVFGPPDFKKKASFCGLDCLSFFIEKLKEQKSRPVQE